MLDGGLGGAFGFQEALPMTRDLRHVMAQFPKNLVAQIVWRVETGLLGKFNSPWLLVQPSCVQ